MLRERGAYGTMVVGRGVGNLLLEDLFKCFDDRYLLDPYHVLGVLFYFIFMYMGVLPSCVSMYHMCAALVQKRGLWIL